MKDIDPGQPTLPRPTSLAVVNGVAYFPNRESGTDSELWRTDGTPAGTALVHDINPGAAGSSPSQFLAAGDTLYFVANDSTGPRLYRTDGTSSGTRRALDGLSGAEALTAPVPMAVAADYLFFRASDPTNGSELRRLGPDGYSLVEDVSPGIGNSVPQVMGVLRFQTSGVERVIFAADNNGSNVEPWATDVTAAPPNAAPVRASSATRRRARCRKAERLPSRSTAARPATPTARSSSTSGT